MRRLTRERFGRLLFLITERDMRHSDGMCACRRILPRLMTGAIRKAVTDLEEAIAQEPEESRWSYLETED